MFCVHFFKNSGDNLFFPSTWRSPNEAQLLVSSTYRGSSAYRVENILGTEEAWFSKSYVESAWIEFTFPSSVTISGFRTKSARRRATQTFKEFQFQSTFDQGSSWRTVYKGTGRKLDCCDWQEFTFDKITSNIFRLNMLSNWKGKNFSIKQLQLRFQRGNKTFWK